VGICGLWCLAGLVSVGVWSGALLGSWQQQEEGTEEPEGAVF
jgi:hypothetical protein